MKKIIIATTALLILTTALHAQKWSAGYRTGVEKKFPQYKRNSDQKLWFWNNQVFLNRKITNRLETEVTLTHNSTCSTDSMTYFDGPVLSVLKGKTHELSLGLNLRYYIYSNSRWQAFAQLGTSANKSWFSYDGLSYDEPNSVPKPYSGKSNSPITVFNTISAGAGANYNLSRRLYCTAQLNGIYNTQASLSYNDFSWVMYAGIGFRF
jgi:hypothetical protein